MSNLAEALRALDADLYTALDRIAVPAWLVDSNARFVYLNRAARDRFGDVEGKDIATVFASDSIGKARAAFARKLVGATEETEYRVTVMDRQGRAIPGEISSVALHGHGHVVGVFGLIDLGGADPMPDVPSPTLTPRQAEVLRHLAAGHSTSQIAQEMSLTIGAVRGHVRDLLARLGVHSRLEAVVRAQALKMLP